MRLPADAVLLIIDAQEAVEGARHGVDDGPEVETNIAALVAAWRAEGLPLAHVGRHPSPGLLLPPLDGEIVIVRNATSAFIGADLEARLDALGATTLVLCGALATHALEASARHAADLGYQVFVVADACRATDTADLEGGSGPLSMCGRWRWRSSKARPRPSSMSRRRSEPRRRPRRVSGAVREEPSGARITGAPGSRRGDWLGRQGQRTSLRHRMISVA